MKTSELSNFDLIAKMVVLSFKVANYHGNKTYPKQLFTVEKELGKRLGLTKEEIDKLGALN